MKINWVYHNNYDIPLKENHRFTSTKFSDLFSELKNSKLYENAIINNRKIMGATNPKDAEDNTIRKLFGISIDKNSVHGSDSVENAKKEIDFFFKN